MTKKKHLYVIGWQGYRDDKLVAGNADILFPLAWGRGDTEVALEFLKKNNELDSVTIAMIFYAGEADTEE